MKNTRILIMSIFLTTSTLMHLQAMERLRTERDAQDPNLSDLGSQTSSDTLSESFVEKATEESSGNAPAAKAFKKQEKKTANTTIGQKRALPAQNNCAKKTKTDSSHLVSEYNEKVTEYLECLKNHQNQEENINLDTFQEQMTSLQYQVSDIVTKKKKIDFLKIKAPISRAKYSGDLKNITYMINFLKNNKDNPLLSSLEPMFFTNWWASVADMIEKENELRRANNNATNASRSAKVYLCIALALGSSLALQIASNYSLGS